MVSPNIWGPHAWKFIHYIILGYPNNPTNTDKENYKNFFNNLHLILPCNSCSINYKNHLIKLPLTNDILNDKNEFIKWGIDLHNIVNVMTNKKIISNDEALKLFQNDFNNNQNNNTNHGNHIMIIILICIIIFLLYKKK
jgi:hypothetical protein